MSLCRTLVVLAWLAALVGAAAAGKNGATSNATVVAAGVEHWSRRCGRSGAIWCKGRCYRASWFHDNHKHCGQARAIGGLVRIRQHYNFWCEGYRIVTDACPRAPPSLQCGNCCPASTLCRGTRCVHCPRGTQECQGRCLLNSVFTTNHNCGSCGNTCAKGQACQAPVLGQRGPWSCRPPP